MNAITFIGITMINSVLKRGLILHPKEINPRKGLTDGKLGNKIIIDI